MINAEVGDIEWRVANALADEDTPTWEAGCEGWRERNGSTCSVDRLTCESGRVEWRDRNGSGACSMPLSLRSVKAAERGIGRIKTYVIKGKEF